MFSEKVYFANASTCAAAAFGLTTIYNIYNIVSYVILSFDGGRGW